MLITSAHSPLAEAIVAGLADRFQVRLTSEAEVRSQHPFVRCELTHDPATRDLVRAMDAIVHVAEPPPGATEAQCIDYRTRSTYNLLRAAAEESVRRVVYLSSLAMMTAHDPRYEVTEDWRAVAHNEASGLSHYLGEFTCREFAREGSLQVVVLRLGTVVRADEVAGRGADPLWVDERDVVQAVSLALSRLTEGKAPKLGAWSVFHIQSDRTTARFSAARAQRVLGYKPSK